MIECGNYCSEIFVAENKMLLGSIHRLDLDRLLNKQLSRANKINYFNKKNNTTQKTTETEQKTIKWNNKDIVSIDL